MNIETEIKLDRFKARPYQQPIFDAIENKGYKRVIAVLPRRAGKDIACWNFMIRQALLKVGVYFMVYPTYAQGRKILWDSLTNAGARFLDYIPEELIANMNQQEMKIRLVNDSLIQVIGSDNFDNLVGTNPRGCVFSEYALQDPRAYQFLRPALTAIDGWAIMISTPRGKNHLWELYQIAINNKNDWFAYTLTVEETGHIPLWEIQKELASGEMSEDLIEQEYYCSFSLGVEGSYYSKFMNKMRLEGRIGIVPYETGFKVHTAWDLGVHDKTVIVFYQTVGQIVRIIDYYENSDKGLDHYAKILNAKDYLYGKHFAPHDIAVRELSTGLSRLEAAKKLGINFTVLPNLPIEDGIECVKAALSSKIWIDEVKCKMLINSLESYRREYDSKRKVYNERPLHDSHSHACFVGDTLINTVRGKIPIKDVSVGDMVVTPLGIRKVLKTHSRITSELYRIKTSTSSIDLTSDHKVFTSNGLVYCDALRYNDVLEHYSRFKVYLWQKLFGFFCEECVIRGFKKTILSLKTDQARYLMDIFINGMDITTGAPLQASTKHQVCSERFGVITMAKYLRDMLYTIKIWTRKIMPSKILSASKSQNISVCMQGNQDLGLSQKDVSNYCEIKMLRQQNGTEVKLGISGTLNTLNHSPMLDEKDTISFVTVVQKNSLENNVGKSSVLIRVKQKIGLIIRKILFIGLVVFVRLYSFVINMLLKKHVVRSVQSFQCSVPEKVYDLTIETDNCYYANGYLVSNSDAVRYLCLSLPKTRDGLSPEDLDRRYQQVMGGDRNANMPSIFRDDLPPY